MIIARFPMSQGSGLARLESIAAFVSGDTGDEPEHDEHEQGEGDKHVHDRDLLMSGR
jgi:hypothetical protein